MAVTLFRKRKIIQRIIIKNGKPQDIEEQYHAKINDKKYARRTVKNVRK